MFLKTIFDYVFVFKIYRMKLWSLIDGQLLYDSGGQKLGALN